MLTNCDVVLQTTNDQKCHVVQKSKPPLCIMDPPLRQCYQYGHHPLLEFNTWSSSIVLHISFYRNMVLYVPPPLHNVKEEDKKFSSVQLKNHVNKYLQQSNGKLFMAM
jgi:hypothetical protein